MGPHNWCLWARTQQATCCTGQWQLQPTVPRSRQPASVPSAKPRPVCQHMIHRGTLTLSKKNMILCS